MWHALSIGLRNVLVLNKGQAITWAHDYYVYCHIYSSPYVYKYYDLSSLQHIIKIRQSHDCNFYSQNPCTGSDGICTVRCHYNMVQYMILHTSLQWLRPNMKHTIYTPYLTLTGELWSIFCEDFGENRGRDNGIALYTEWTPVLPELITCLDSQVLDWNNCIIIMIHNSVWFQETTINHKRGEILSSTNIIIHIRVFWIPPQTSHVNRIDVTTTLIHRLWLKMFGSVSLETPSSCSSSFS